LRKRWYILFVARDAEGQLRKIPIPVHYLYVFLAGALIGMFTITGMAGSYARMLWKVERFNDLRAEKEQIKRDYSQLEQDSHEKDVQVASLGDIAGEVSAIYGLKTDTRLLPANEDVRPGQYQASLDTLYALRGSALAGAAAAGLQTDSTRRLASLSDWTRAADAPSLWPVEGSITSSFGERVDPFNGEGAFHSGLDISVPYGTPIHASADGVVTYADIMSGYGNLIELDHGHGISTRYGHLSGFAIASGQHVRRGQVIGYVGATGRTTGAHLHYEVRVQNVPVNPHKYLRTTTAQLNQQGNT
jgi:murein DD-endopeptidase MepM/ murein hydrolase activator NlpD